MLHRPAVNDVNVMMYGKAPRRCSINIDLFKFEIRQRLGKELRVYMTDKQLLNIYG